VSVPIVKPGAPKGKSRTRSIPWTDRQEVYDRSYELRSSHLSGLGRPKDQTSKFTRMYLKYFGPNGKGIDKRGVMEWFGLDEMTDTYWKLFSGGKKPNEKLTLKEFKEALKRGVITYRAWGKPLELLAKSENLVAVPVEVLGKGVENMGLTWEMIKGNQHLARIYYNARRLAGCKPYEGNKKGALKFNGPEGRMTAQLMGLELMDQIFGHLDKAGYPDAARDLKLNGRPLLAKLFMETLVKRYAIHNKPPSPNEVRSFVKLQKNEDAFQSWIKNNNSWIKNNNLTSELKDFLHRGNFRAIHPGSKQNIVKYLLNNYKTLGKAGVKKLLEKYSGRKSAPGAPGVPNKANGGRAVEPARAGLDMLRMNGQLVQVA